VRAGRASHLLRSLPLPLRAACAAGMRPLLALLAGRAVTAQVLDDRIDPPGCRFAYFADQTAVIDRECCNRPAGAGGACFGHGPPQQCSPRCAEVYVPFYSQCEATFNIIFDGVNGEALDGEARTYRGLYDSCLDENLVDVSALLGRVAQLRSAGCEVDLLHTTVAEAEDGHRRAQLPDFGGGGGGRSCADIVAVQGWEEQVNSACCPDPVGKTCPFGYPIECSAECAFTFVPFFNDCRAALSAALDEGMMQNMAQTVALCGSQATRPLLSAITSAQCPHCSNGVVDLAEECDAGGANSELPNAPCRTNCLRPACGDNVVDSPAESCDPPDGVSCTAGCQIDLCLATLCTQPHMSGVCRAGVCECTGCHTGEDCLQSSPLHGLLEKPASLVPVRKRSFLFGFWFFLFNFLR
jgi:hypothetical protein